MKVTFHSLPEKTPCSLKNVHGLEQIQLPASSGPKLIEKKTGRNGWSFKDRSIVGDN